MQSSLKGLNPVRLPKFQRAQAERTTAAPTVDI